MHKQTLTYECSKDKLLSLLTADRSKYFEVAAVKVHLRQDHAIDENKHFYIKKQRTNMVMMAPTKLHPK
jgi:hypothetical protein